jgi:hypothetical protein
MGRWSWDRVAAGSGILAVALLIASSFIPGTPPKLTDSSSKIVNYFVNHHRSGLIATIIGGLGALAIVWFVATVASAIRRSGEDRLAAVALAGGVSAIGLGVLGSVLNGALFYSVALDSPNLAKPLYVTGIIATTFIWFPVTAFLAATTYASMRTHLFPQWYSMLSGLAAIIVLFGGGALAHKGFYSPTGAYGFISFFAFVAWVVLTSSLLMAQAEKSPQTAFSPA